MSSIPPWHMWGTSVTVVVPAGASQPTQQLARIEFDRPAAWSFMLWAELPQPISTPSIDVLFKIILGVGRGQLSMETKLRAAFGPGPAGVSQLAWTQVIPSVGVVDPVTDLVVSQQVEVLTAQTINASATILNAPAGGARVTVGSFFAPYAHTRAEWYSNIAARLARR